MVYWAYMYHDPTILRFGASPILAHGRPKIAQNDQELVRLLWSAVTAVSAWFLGGTSLKTSHPGYLNQIFDLCQPQFWPTGAQK